MNNPERTYTLDEVTQVAKKLAEDMKPVIKAEIVNELRDNNLLKEEIEPGTFKKMVAGILHKGTKHVSAAIADIKAEGEEVLLKNALSSIDEKAKTRELKEATEAIEKKYSRQS